jgi:hypothetical protein
LTRSASTILGIEHPSTVCHCRLVEAPEPPGVIARIGYRRLSSLTSYCAGCSPRVPFSAGRGRGAASQRGTKRDHCKNIKIVKTLFLGQGFNDFYLLLSNIFYICSQLLAYFLFVRHNTPGKKTNFVHE